MENPELECRVCRCGTEDARPLFHPCVCKGSIGLVHQDCLEAWLTHSQKDKCELCSTKYIFEPEYDASMPNVVPWHVYLKAGSKLFGFKLVPFIMKISLALLSWVIFVPLWTCWVYRIYFREQSYKDVILTRLSWSTLQGDIVSGLVIIGVILLSSIILVCFPRYFYEFN